RLAEAEGVSVDLEPDVYESLKRSRVVLGEASTVLFEATAFGCHVIARDSAFADNVIGDAFGALVADAAEAVVRLQHLISVTDLPSSAAAIWAPAAVDSYRQWLAGRRAELESL